MLRKLVYAGVILGICAGPAAAQDSFGIPVNPKRPPSGAEIEKRKATDRDYDAAMKKIPDKNTSADPWAVVRPNASQTSRKQQQ
jgi:hypothetical protein